VTLLSLASRAARWTTFAGVASAILLVVAVCVGALFWPAAMQANGAGGFFGWGLFGWFWGMPLLALLAARFATRRQRGLSRLFAGFGTAMAVVGVFTAVHVVLLLVDPHDANHRT
jgi:hypothetical protein